MAILSAYDVAIWTTSLIPDFVILSSTCSKFRNNIFFKKNKKLKRIKLKWETRFLHMVQVVIFTLNSLGINN